MKIVAQFPEVGGVVTVARSFGLQIGGSSRLAVQSEGVLVGRRATVNFTSDIEEPEDDADNNRVNIPLGVSGAFVRQTTAALTINVDGAGGDDLVGDGSADAPLATLTVAKALIATRQLHDVLIRIVTAGTYTCPSFGPFLHDAGQVLIYGVPVTEIIAPTSALSGSSTILIVTTGLTANAHRGKFVEATFVSGLVERRQIHSNTTTNIVPVRAFSQAVATTTTFRVFEPAVLLDTQSLVTGTSSRTRFVGAAQSIRTGGYDYVPTLALANVELYSATAGSAIVCIGAVTFYGVIAGPNVDLYVGEDGRINAGVDVNGSNAALSPFRAGLTTTTTAWSGYGLTFEVADGPTSLCYHGYVVAEGAVLVGRCIVRGGNCHGLSATPATPAVRVSNRAFVAFLGLSGSPLPAIASASTLAALLISDGAVVTAERLNVVCTGTGSAAVMTERRGQFNVTSASNVTGSGESFGLRARRGGGGYLNAGSTALTYSGAAADTRGALAVGESPSILGGTCLALGTDLATEGACIVSTNGDGSVIQRAA